MKEMPVKKNCKDFTRELASNKPAPGGGGTTALPACGAARPMAAEALAQAVAKRT